MEDTDEPPDDDGNGPKANTRKRSRSHQGVQDEEDHKTTVTQPKKRGKRPEDKREATVTDDDGLLRIEDCAVANPTSAAVLL